MNICTNCNEKVSRKKFIRCRKCNDIFQIGKNSPRYKHGLKSKYGNNKFYVCWLNIRRRCSKKSSKDFPRYGGKGIKCNWSSFEEFKNDMFRSYLEHVKNFSEKETQIDRIDPYGNYEKTNCRWVTPKIQQRNKTNNIQIIFDNKKQCLSAWAEELNFPYKLLRQRIIRRKWPITKAFTTPRMKNQFR